MFRIHKCKIVIAAVSYQIHRSWARLVQSCNATRARLNCASGQES